MKYKVGDQVVIRVEIPKEGHKRILIREPKPDSKIVEKICPIVIKHEIEQSYTIIIEDDIIGWYISKFHVKHNNVDEKYLNKKFYDVTEEFIVRKK